MSITFLQTESSSDNDLPWVNEYLDKGGDEDIVTPMLRFVKTSKGAIVITKYFKGFLFKGQATLDQLLEALPMLAEERSMGYGLVVAISSNGKIQIGMDDELDFICVQNKKGNFDFKSVDTQSTQVVQTSNPFLKEASPSLTTNSRAKKAKPVTSTSEHPPY